VHAVSLGMGEVSHPFNLLPLTQPEFNSHFI
jgi:hypothetical protein